MRFSLKLWLRATVVLIACLQVTTANSFGSEDLRLKRCNELLAAGFSHLTPEQKSFLEKQLLPVAGLRTILQATGEIRPCAAQAHCIRLSSFTEGKDLQVEWVSGLAEPKIESSSDVRMLKVPEGFRWESLPGEGRELIQKYLIGHTLHPFAYSPVAKSERKAVGEPVMILKEVQKNAIEAAQAAIARGDRKFLFVAPTGTGKTEVLLSVLHDRLKSASRKLHVLVADQNFLVEQLRADVEVLQSGLPLEKQFRILVWGGQNKAQSIEALSKIVESSSVPVVLISTIQSFKARVGSGDTDANLGTLRNMLGTFIFDEVHHAGAEEAKGLLHSLSHHPDSDAFFYGTTATPVHRDASIHELFDGMAFWAYLDTAALYRQHAGSFERSMEDIVEQLAQAIMQGELTPFDKTYFINPTSLSHGHTDFFIPANGHASRYIINPAYHSEVADRLRSLFQKHNKGFVTASTIEEAKAFTQLFNDSTPGKVFAVFHSKMSAAELKQVAQGFSDGKIQYLVTVKKLDEGINFPELTLYVDLNRTLGPRQFLQRAGRALRISVGKEAADIVTFMEIDENELRDKIVLIDQVLAGRLQGKSKRATGDAAPTTSEEAGYQAELRTLQAELKDFWNHREARRPSYLVAAERLNEWLSQNGTLRRSGGSTGENALYQLVHIYKHHLGFLRALNESSLQYVFSVIPRAPQDVGQTAANFIELRGRAPSLNDPNEARLYSAIQKFADHPDFKAHVPLPVQMKLESDEDISEAGVASRLISFVSERHALPSERSPDRSEQRLALMTQYYRNELGFVHALTTHEQSKLVDADETAILLLDFYKAENRLPDLHAESPSERWLAFFVKLHLSDVQFRENLTAEINRTLDGHDPLPAEAPKSTLLEEPDAEEIALRLIDFFDLKGDIPHGYSFESTERGLWGLVQTLKDQAFFVDLLPPEIQERLKAIIPAAEPLVLTHPWEIPQALQEKPARHWWAPKQQLSLQFAKPVAARAWKGPEELPLAEAAHRFLTLLGYGMNRGQPGVPKMTTAMKEEFLVYEAWAEKVGSSPEFVAAAQSVSPEILDAVRGSKKLSEEFGHTVLSWVKAHGGRVPSQDATDSSEKGMAQGTQRFIEDQKFRAQFASHKAILKQLDKQFRSTVPQPSTSPSAWSIFKDNAAKTFENLVGVEPHNEKPVMLSLSSNGRGLRMQLEATVEELSEMGILVIDAPEVAKAFNRFIKKVGRIPDAEARDRREAILAGLTLQYLGDPRFKGAVPSRSYAALEAAVARIVKSLKSI